LSVGARRELTLPEDMARWDAKLFWFVIVSGLMVVAGLVYISEGRDATKHVKWKTIGPKDGGQESAPVDMVAICDY
jgi:hypothetical protein